MLTHPAIARHVRERIHLYNMLKGFFKVVSALWGFVLSSLASRSSHPTTLIGVSDLLKRHAAGHTNRKHQKGYLAHSKRVSQACKACAHAKLKCKEEKPCQRCHSKGILCEYNDAGDSRAQIWHEDSSANEQSVSSNVPATDVTMNHAPMTEHIENLEMPEMRDYVPSAVQDLDGWMPRSPLSANGHIDGRMGETRLS